MTKADRSAAVVLALFVDPPTGPRGRSVESTALREHRARLVRALLAGSPGREIDGSFGDACLTYGQWPEGLDAAIALLSQLPRLPKEFAGIEVRIGIDLAGALGEPVAAAWAAKIARSAGINEIRLGSALARLVERNPKDRLVVRQVDAAIAGGKVVHRLARARDELPSNLETPATSFVGRGAEIAEIRGRLERGRLVTITGPPGTGKSRLASEVADRIHGRYRDGAWFVALAPITDLALVMSAVGAALGIPVPAGLLPGAAVAAHLKDRQLLVVLDNFEHLMAARAEVSDLIAAAPGVHLLVTSQMALDIPGEQEVVLEPLEVSRAGSGSGTSARSAAVELFSDRAAAAQPTFQLGEDNVAGITEVCRRLDGLPLAIELAAARVKVLSVAAILERLNARLGLLGDGSEQPARHDSLRAAIGWSYDLLDPRAQRLFRRLSVFRGGWTVEAALGVCSEDQAGDDSVLAGLASLQQASLLIEAEPESASPRFTMLETLRQFAAERLDSAGESDRVRRLHADHYLAFVARFGPRVTGPDQTDALDRLAIEHDNVRAALAYLIQEDATAALRLGADVWRFWQMRGHLAEGSRWLDAAIGGAGDHAPEEDQARGRAAAGGLAYWRGDLRETEQQYERAVALRRTMGDDVKLADALFDLAFVFDPLLRPPPEDPERTATGVRIAEEAHALYVNAPHEPGIAKSEWLLGSVIAGRDIERATALLSSSVDRFRRLQDPFGLGWALHSYGLTLLRSTDSDSAAAAFGEALGLFAAAADGSATALLLDDFAEVAKAEGDALRAARLKGAASGMRTSSQAELVVANAPWLFGDTVPRGLIDPAALEQAWAEGRTLSQVDAIAYALGSAAATVPENGLRVSALGPLLVERSGQPVSDWGGPKAGNRHALAIFAFLMDRGERGVTKDEFIEVLWPDAAVEQGDLNFHRTLGGLRSTLARGAGSRSGGEVVFTNGRYRLVGSVVAWLDVAEFQQRLLNAAEASDEISAIRGLEAARLLYRGDYLDDCPFYGDSEYVEERRRFLRGRLVDSLVDLGRRYESRHDESLASARFREAIDISGGDCTSASEGLERLGVMPGQGSGSPHHRPPAHLD